MHSGPGVSPLQLVGESRPGSQHKETEWYLAGGLQSQCCGIYRDGDNDAAEHKSQEGD